MFLRYSDLAVLDAITSKRENGGNLDPGRIWYFFHPHPQSAQSSEAPSEGSRNSVDAGLAGSFAFVGEQDFDDEDTLVGSALYIRHVSIGDVCRAADGLQTIFSLISRRVNSPTTLYQVLGAE